MSVVTWRTKLLFRDTSHNTAIFAKDSPLSRGLVDGRIDVAVSANLLLLQFLVVTNRRAIARMLASVGDSRCGV